MYYYQQIDDIGKEIAVVSMTNEVNDLAHYRPITKDYYDAVVEFLCEQARQTEAEEVVKEDMPSGDYLNPIPYTEGLEVTAGLFYYTEDRDLPAEALKSGVASGWNTEWFDIVA